MDVVNVKYPDKYSMENDVIRSSDKFAIILFEKRHLGDIQSRFSSLDTIRSIFTNSIVTGIIDSIMTIGLLVMLTLYGGWLVWVVIGFTIAMRLCALLPIAFIVA